MIRQAISYLRGAISSVALVAAAVIAAALIMVSVGTGSSPLGVLGLGDSGAEAPIVTSVEETPAGDDRRRAMRPRGDRSAAATEPRAQSVRRRARAQRRARERRQRRSQAQPQPKQTAPTGGEIIADVPSTTPRTSEPTPTPRSPGRVGGGDSGGPSQPAPPRNAGSGGGGGSGEIISDVPEGSSGQGGSGLSSLNEGVNRTVDTLDKTLGGTLEKTGLGKTVKETTDGLIGPKSGLGKTVEGVTGGLGKLLGRK